MSPRLPEPSAVPGSSPLTVGESNVMCSPAAAPESVPKPRDPPSQRNGFSLNSKVSAEGGGGGGDGGGAVGATAPVTVNVPERPDDWPTAVTVHDWPASLGLHCQISCMLPDPFAVPGRSPPVFGEMNVICSPAAAPDRAPNACDPPSQRNGFSMKV